MTNRSTSAPHARSDPNTYIPSMKQKITSNNLFHCRLHAQGDITEGQCVKRCHDLTRIEVRAIADKITHVDDLRLLMALEEVLCVLEGRNIIDIDHPMILNLQWAIYQDARSITTDI